MIHMLLCSRSRAVSLSRKTITSCFFRTLKNSDRFFSSSIAAHSDSSSNSSNDEFISINWRRKDGSTSTTQCKVGENIMRAAHATDIEIEGACEGVCACSTCHVILEDKVYDKLPDASEREEDMLDQAFGLTASSRLGCQVILEKSHNNMTVILPAATRNFYVDGHKPKHH